MDPSWTPVLRPRRTCRPVPSFSRTIAARAARADPSVRQHGLAGDHAAPRARRARSRRQRPEFGAATPAAPAARRSMRPPCRAAVFSDSLDAVTDQRCRTAAQPAIGAATEDAPSHSAAVARPHRRSYTRLIRRGRVVSSCIRLIRADMRPYQEVADASGIHGCAA